MFTGINRECDAPPRSQGLAERCESSATGPLTDFNFAFQNLRDFFRVELA